MVSLDLIKEISLKTPSKIVLVVIDGLGGLPDPATGKTELETARTPNIDKLLSNAICGLVDPVSPGITPGSGPGHLALFGYDPVKYNIGRGVLEATGITFDLKPGDVATRGNFCTVDDKGIVTDRRAGRIPTSECARLCQMLRQIELPGVEVLVEPVQDYRFVLVLRGEGLSADLSETDPQRVGVAPPPVHALSSQAAAAADLANRAGNPLPGNLINKFR